MQLVHLTKQVVGGVLFVRMREMNKQVIRDRLECTRQYTRSCSICPFGHCNKKACYGIFTQYDRWRLYYSMKKCPCHILDKDYVIKRTREWLKED